MAPKFGTSGLRGLVVELTPALVANYIRAFLAACPCGTGLYVARDLRPSSAALSDVVVRAALERGVDVTDCGEVPTPALALAAMQAGAAAVMVTGSHIPADRNGLKFYVPSGEITKADEAAILAQIDRTVPDGCGHGRLCVDMTAGADWVARYVSGFGPSALGGLRVGVWAHSAVSRDLLGAALRALGADVVEVGRVDTFVPVDTEAVSAEARRQIAAWVAAERLDALVSTDGDGDRPLLADDRGEVIAGDILGQITARAVGAETVVTPVTSNSGAELCGHFASVVRTKVGSPFVIAAMAQVGGRVAGYEANGGFLLGFDAQLQGPLAGLMTRDSLLPLVAVLVEGRKAGRLSDRIAQEPPRVTMADRIENFDTALSLRLVGRLADATERAAFMATLGLTAARWDASDGMRIWSDCGACVHIRASGNAPELRVYVETSGKASASELLARALAQVRV